MMRCAGYWGLSAILGCTSVRRQVCIETISSFLLAAAVGAAQLWLAKGTSLHRTLGYVWAGLTVFVAFTGFFIFETDVAAPFNYLSTPLSALVLVMLWWGIRLARAGKIKQHRQTMIQLFWLTMSIGLLTIQPGRIVHQMLTGV